MTAQSERVYAEPARTFTEAPVRDLLPAMERSLAAARQHLLSIQHEDGHWVAELEGDTILESEYILTMHFLGRTHEPRVGKAAEWIRRKQLPEGGWAIYPGGPPEVSASVKAYFVLKLLGDPADAPHMSRARESILRLGGIEACNSFTKIYLAIFGQYPWERCPAVPPEMMLLPKHFPFNIYEMSSWSRAIVVPLGIIWAHKPRCAVPDHASIRELHVPTGHRLHTGVLRFIQRRNFWTYYFHLLDQALKLAERLPWKPLRSQALERAEAWILQRLEHSDGLGAIFPPIVNTIFALRCLGYGDDHPVLQRQVRELEKLEVEDGDVLRVQPCFSPVWDTGLTLQALLESGVEPAHPAVQAGVRWLLDKEVRRPGDWTQKVKNVEPGGWYFEYANEFYPDCDDTAEVLNVLSKVPMEDPDQEQRRRGAMRRGLAWLLAMQNQDGGWAAFDKGCEKQFLTHVPFADHNAMLDPSCEDITGRVLECLSQHGFGGRDPAVARGAGFLYARQEPDGTWYGRWGCNYLYGTWLALRGLRASGVVHDEAFTRAAAWIRSVQNDDGGWGELPRSYDEPETKGRGPSTASQTAWALMGLLAAGDTGSDALARGFRFLLERQRPDGSWEDEPWTGTGFPRVFYLNYHLYATYFPLMAMGALRRALRAPRSPDTGTES